MLRSAYMEPNKFNALWDHHTNVTWDNIIFRSRSQTSCVTSSFDKNSGRDATICIARKSPTLLTATEVGCIVPSLASKVKIPAVFPSPAYEHINTNSENMNIVLRYSKGQVYTNTFIAHQCWPLTERLNIFLLQSYIWEKGWNFTKIKPQNMQLKKYNHPELRKSHTRD